jgi:hypothetical protein
MGRHLAAGRHREPKELTRGFCGSWRKLAAACRKVPHRAAVAQCKRNIFGEIQIWRNRGSWSKLATAGMRMTHSAKVAWGREHGLQRQGKADIAPRTQKGRTSRMKCWKGPECKIGIKDPC